MNIGGFAGALAGHVEKSDAVAQERGEAAGGSVPPETAPPASTGHETPPQAMSDRVIDTERAGGTGNVAPKAAGKSAPPMTADEAAAYVGQNVRWRAGRARADQAMIALDDEADRLQRGKRRPATAHE